MKLYETLEKVLKKEPNFITDSGELKKWVIINKAQNYDAELIELLLENNDLKEKFFIKVKDSLVFNESLFIQFLEQKNYLNDSYTAYRNKIGLALDGKFLNQRNEVSLVWPFKDCILEGGQSKEEDKREEIFFNETLAQDEITQLLEPKVFTNGKRFSTKGEKQFDKFKRNEKGTITDNLVIKGNNLLALHSLKKEFIGLVKLIYIDPPYNTGGDSNIFSYNNSFNHSTWLTFMKNRLIISRDLLRNDGFISIAIDHFELGYLLVLADEIFGRENRIGIISIVNNPMGRNQAKFFSTINDFMLVYAKDISQAKFNNVILNNDFLETFDKEDEVGKFKLNNFIRIGGGDGNLRENKSSFWYPLFVKKDLSEISTEETDNTIKVYPVTSSGQERTWKLSKNSTKKILNDLVAEKIGDEIIIYEKYRVEKGQKVPTVWTDKKYNSNHHGVRLLEKILNINEFSFPKSLFTIVDILKIMSNDKDIIMDFHSGSATTGHAAFLLNKEDGKTRQFILVEQLNSHLELSKKRLYNVLKQEKIDSSFIYFELKKYNEIFIDKIEKAKDSMTLLNIWEEMKNKSFLNYNVDIKKQDDNLEEFKSLSIKNQKKVLLELLDKNQLYVNLSSLNDKDFTCTEEEKKITKDFYQLKNK